MYKTSAKHTSIVPILRLKFIKHLSIKNTIIVVYATIKVKDITIFIPSNNLAKEVA